MHQAPKHRIRVAPVPSQDKNATAVFIWVPAALAGRGDAPIMSRGAGYVGRGDVPRTRHSDAVLGTCLPHLPADTTALGERHTQMQSILKCKVSSILECGNTRSRPSVPHLGHHAIKEPDESLLARRVPVSQTSPY